ncbi:MAG: hypothetical protein Q4G30_03455 [Actinomycetaceae bacterium]|nr:hypothetical protein [Actinomycetaceae bacterium]
MVPKIVLSGLTVLGCTACVGVAISIAGGNPRHGVMSLIALSVGSWLAGIVLRVAHRNIWDWIPSEHPLKTQFGIYYSQGGNEKFGSPMGSRSPVVEDLVQWFSAKCPR